MPLGSRRKDVDARIKSAQDDVKSFLRIRHKFTLQGDFPRTALQLRGKEKTLGAMVSIGSGLVIYDVVNGGAPRSTAITVALAASSAGCTAPR